MDKFKKLKFPIPPLEEQERIVSILDRFDKLCNDISEGLPAEIEARQKQYEYYRDKLLTFKMRNQEFVILNCFLSFNYALRIKNYELVRG